MRPEVLLSLVPMVLMACHKEKREDTPQPAPRFSLDGRKDAIPLDVVGDEPTFALVGKDVASLEAKPLTNFEGRPKAPYVMPEREGFSMRETASVAQFAEFFIVSERSPSGAQGDPSERIYNLPELMDRLIHEEKLPDDVLSAYQTSDSELLIVIKKPTVLAASFSQGRTVQIINRSRLVLLCPYCENIEIRQSKPLEAKDEPAVQIYSNICLSYDYRSPGKLERFLFGDSFLGDLSARAKCDRLDPRKPREVPVVPEPSKLGLELWMPQALLTQQIRKEHIAETAARWRALYPISSVR